METGFWLSITLACLLGAMSPGPSLAVIVNLSVSGGRLAGTMAAISHGLMVGLYAFATASGLEAILDHQPVIFKSVQIAGCLFLLLMAIGLLFASGSNLDTYSVAIARSSKWLAARDGFLIALVNPKTIVFFSALFSQFVDANSQLWEKVLMAIIAAGVDMLWYTVVAVIISQSTSLTALHRRTNWVNKLFAVVLMVIAIGFIFEISR